MRLSYLGRCSNFLDVQLTVGQRLELQIEDVAFGGEGVGRHQGCVVFTPFVDIGEEVEVEIVEVKSSYARAVPIAIKQPSVHRVQPVCPYFGSCGGCQYQHLKYERQLELKHKQVRDLLMKIGKLSDVQVRPVLPSPEQFGYRIKIMVRARYDRDAQKWRIGFLHLDNRTVVDLEECKLARPEINSQLAELRSGPPPKRNGVKFVLRIPPPGWEVPPDSFFQNNLAALPLLIDTVRKFHGVAGTRYLIDVYCGVGLFGIELASQLESFLGIEIDRRAIAAAIKNAAARNVVNGTFIAGPAEALLQEYISKYTPRETTVIVDPPRVGCLPGTLQAIRDAKPTQVIYVSCNPSTLARDLTMLCQDGLYRVECVQPIDMFPQTKHIETVSDLRLN